MVKFYGRGGQGAVTASRLIGVAALYDGKYATSIGLYGGERRGAPVDVFLRISDEPIRTKSFPSQFDCIIVSDPKIEEMVDVSQGFRSGGVAVLNTRRDPRQIQLKVNPGRIGVVDATNIAIDTFGPSALPITSTAMMGAFSKTTGLVSMESMIKAVQDEWTGPIVERNARAIKRAYDETNVIVV